MYKKLPRNTPTILRSCGLKVVEVDGWYNRERGPSHGGFNPQGTLIHHTATSKRTSIKNTIALLVKGRSGLPGPLCQFGLGRDGTVYVISAGRANHAGTARSVGSVASGDGNELYVGVEGFNDGVGEPWPDVQYRAYVRLAAAISVKFTGNSVRTVAGHKETSTKGKIDPLFNMDNFREKVAHDIDLLKGKGSKRPPVKDVELPKPKGPYKDFRVHLAPGNKNQSDKSVLHDMELVKKGTKGKSGILFQTERTTPRLRGLATKGLGKGWTTVFDNENQMAYGSAWLFPEAEATLLAKEDPSMAKVSPPRHADVLRLKNFNFKHGISFIGTHLVSEANCEHKNVYARKWREKTFKIQLEDLLDVVAKEVDAGLPVILAGDFNTGIYFTSKQLLEALQKRFGPKAKALHLSRLDAIYAIDSDKVVFSEFDKDIVTDNGSDHDMITVSVRAAAV